MMSMIRFMRATITETIMTVPMTIGMSRTLTAFIRNVEEQGKDERDAVYRPVLTDSSQGTEGESDYYRYSQSAEGQRQSVGKPKQEFIYNRAGIIP